MKKSMIFAAMAAVALVSCNNNDFLGEDDETTGSSQRVEIKVGQTVEGLTKAAIETGMDVEATIIATKGNAPGDWSNFVPRTENTFAQDDTWNEATFANVATASFEAGADKAVGMGPLLYACPDSGATLTGVAPRGTVVGGRVVFDVKDGEQDVMVAETTAKNDVTVTPSPAIAPFALTFKHKTAQLRFSFAATNRTGDGAWVQAPGVNERIVVKSVEVKNAQVPAAVRLNGFSIDWELARVELKGMTRNVIPLTYGVNNQGKADFITIDKSAMVRPVNPGAGDSEIELSIVLTINGVDKRYPSVKPKKVGGGALRSEEGKYNNISLTIKQPATPTGTPAITATATVTPWGKGDEGEANLD